MLYKKRCRKIKKYIREFCDTVRRDFPQIPITGNSPVVKLYRHCVCVPTDTQGLEFAEKTAEGRPIINGQYYNGIIEIYGITERKPAELRETARHECIHFLLDKSGLPYKDSDDLFTLLAIAYNAQPTEVLKNPEKWIF